MVHIIKGADYKLVRQSKSNRNFHNILYRTIPRGSMELLCSKSSDNLMQHLAGKRIGGGCYREVHEYKPAKDKVIKIARNMQGIYCNIMEDTIWRMVKDTPLSKYFIPVVALLYGGQGIVMERATKTLLISTDDDWKVHDFLNTLRKRYPKFEAILRDIHTENVMWYHGDLVIVDYGSLYLNRFSSMITK